MSDAGSYESDDASKLAGELFGGKLTVEEALKRLRTRLLDLSMRNRLLNYRHPKGRAVQFINDPDLDLLFDRLEEGKVATLAHVPDPPLSRYDDGKKPEVRTYAGELGIGTAVEFQGAKANGNYRRMPGLQVLQYPTDLEKFLRKLATEARTVVEETGTNMLYLMFGFLEFYDSEDSQKACLAPLISMPANLTKGTLNQESRTYSYDLTYSGEDIVENFTLREKLRQEFRLELPELDPEDSPECYFEKIQAAVSKRRNWCVRRRLSLGFLSFGKLAIWADLDPAKAKSLLTNPLLKDIFEGGRASSSGAFHAEDYDIDKHPDGELPLIYDADSSQHSAIIDVRKGTSLVINGPPGTGKSQTITNIIASAMAAGKKVLFVSEKLAALEVVKQRLGMAGLGDFCLELHSHKTQKKKLLENIEQRIGSRFSAPAGYASRVEVLRERRRTLNAYAELLGSRIGNQLDLSAHDVFWATERRRTELGGLAEAVSDLRFSLAAEWASDAYEGRRSTLSSAAAAATELGCRVADSPWRGFAPELMVRGDEFPVLKSLDLALGHARAMETAAAALANVTGYSAWTFQELLRAQAAFEGLSGVGPEVQPELLVQLFPQGLKTVAASTAVVARLTAALSQIRSLQETALSNLRSLDVGDSARFAAVMSLARERLAEPALHLTPKHLAAAGVALAERLSNLRAILNENIVHVPREPRELASMLAASPALTGASSLASQSAGILRQASDEASGALGGVSAGLKQVSELLRSTGLSFGGHTDDIQTLLDGRGLPELIHGPLPSNETIAALRELLANGWGGWTAERFSATGRELKEEINGAALAVESLNGLTERIGIPAQTTSVGLQALETLLTIAEDAPVDLLALRAVGFEDPEFAEVAIKAEDTHKMVLQLAGKVQDAFHVDTLPDSEVLKICIRVFRRGDSLFNFFKSDWRQAKAIYVGCTKQRSPLTAKAMGERMSVALRWREAAVDYTGNQQFRDKLGRVFEGTTTDYSKLRRLHGWYRKSAAALLTDGDVGLHVNLTTISEQHLALIAAQASRVRGWMRTLQELPKRVAQLPGLDPALARTRKLDELLPPLSEYAQRVHAASAQLKLVVRPTADVSRAVRLLEVKTRLEQNASFLQGLLDCPRQLAEVAVRIGLSGTPHSYQHLSESVDKLTRRADEVGELGRALSEALGSDVTPSEARDVLSALAAVSEAASTLLAQGAIEKRRDWTKLIDGHSGGVRAATELATFLEPVAKAEASAWHAGVSVQAALDAESELAQVAGDANFQSHLGSALRGLNTDEAAIAACLAWADVVQNAAKNLPAAVANSLLGKDAHTVEAEGSAAITACTASFAAYKAAMSEFEKFGVLDWAAWGGSPTPGDAASRLAQAREGAGVLIPWSKYLASKEDAGNQGLSELLGRLEAGHLPPEKLVAAFELVFYRSLSKGIISSKRVLARFSGTGHDQVREDFMALDKELIALNGAEYASKIDKAKKPQAGVSSGRAGDLTEMSLLVKETKKQKRHIPIRQLLSRAGHSLQELKPCFMMGPLSVAQYLEQGVLKFDLVVMDEASQLRPEDALGAVARGAQLVVVGDPKQLPPTNFFDRLMDGDEEDPDEAPAIMEGVESILGICEHLYRPVRTLRWHYRSKHESLIAFSNSQFYRGNLVVFPSPYKRNKKLGVNYRYVTDGLYQDRRNVPEAQRVVDSVIEHMLTSPDESLGVVTLNQTQRELIEDLLDKKVRDVAGVSEYMARHEDAGWKFFVKNLENVQGDERDVIFVSTTFGKPPNSRTVRQNFGPINRPDGWRRLNVLFTRARKRLDLFTSMLPSDVQADGTASAGRRALHDYLEFARTGNLPPSNTETGVREADSDFELAVADALMLQGYETEPQVGVAGYFLDIGVRNPNRPSEFLAGIECDGVTYHSSLSARDRDRIRQEVLESLGWRGRIIRVWSTDWFADPQSQTQRLLKFLQGRREASSLETLSYSDEDLEVFEESAGASGFGGLADEPGADVMVVPEVVVESSADAFVEVGDRVAYVVLELPDERHTVQIVDSQSNPRLNLLNEQTPVALALLGLGVGEDAPLLVPGQPRRTVRVVKILRETDEG